VLSFSGPSYYGPSCRLLGPSGVDVVTRRIMGVAGGGILYDVEDVTLVAAGTYTIVVDATAEVGGRSTTRSASIAPARCRISRYRPHDHARRTILPGQDVTVSWRDNNGGGGAAVDAWQDRVLVRNASTGAVVVDVTLPYDPQAQGALQVGEYRDRQYSFKWPSGRNATGASR